MALSQRYAELTLDCVGNEMPELNIEGLIEPQRLGDLHALLRRCVLPQHRQNRIADITKQRKGHQSDETHHRKCLKQPSEDEREHIGA